jgi:ribonuclease P protein component
VAPVKSRIAFRMIFSYMKSMVETFQKSERLCSRKTITMLFDEGNIFYPSLFKIVWCKNPVKTPFPAQVAFSVSKKGFRKAVDRNLLKRRMREAYRRNKQKFYDFLNSMNIQIALIIIFRENDIADYQTIEKSMAEMLDRLTSEVRKNLTNC